MPSSLKIFFPSFIFTRSSHKSQITGAEEELYKKNRPAHVIKSKRISLFILTHREWWIPSFCVKKIQLGKFNVLLIK